MDAATDRVAKAKSREPLNSRSNTASDAPPENPVGVAEGYERWAPVYDRSPNPLLSREERYLLPILPDLRNKSVLDLACGTGRWLERVLLLGSESAVGVDCSMPMLEVAARKLIKRGLLVRGSCERLPLSREAFDVVICSFAVGHVSNLDIVARELARVTRIDGDVFVSDLHPEAYARGWRVGFRDGATHIHILTQNRSSSETVEAFCLNGFKCQRTVTLSLGAPEEPLFVQAGKGHFFLEACRVPAVLVCHFRRLDSAVDGWNAR